MQQFLQQHYQQLLAEDFHRGLTLAVSHQSVYERDKLSFMKQTDAEKRILTEYRFLLYDSGVGAANRILCLPWIRR